MVSRKIIIAVAAVQLLAALLFLGLNEFANVGKFVAFRNVTIAHHQGGDVDAELGKSIRRLGDEFYYPSVAFGGFCVLSSLAVGIMAVRRAK